MIVYLWFIFDSTQVLDHSCNRINTTRQSSNLSPLAFFVFATALKAAPASRHAMSERITTKDLDAEKENEKWVVWSAMVCHGRLLAIKYGVNRLSTWTRRNMATFRLQTIVLIQSYLVMSYTPASSAPSFMICRVSSTSLIASLVIWFSKPIFATSRLFLA